MKVRTIAISLLIAGSFGVMRVSNAQSKECSQNKLPAAAQALLHSKFPTFHVVELSDLAPDERMEWTEHEGAKCPGIAEGEFSRNLAGYVVSLTRKAGLNRGQQVLVFLRSDQKGYDLHILSPRSTVESHTLVVSLGKPGQYHPVNGGESVTMHWPVILYEAIDAGIVGYYYANNQWHEIQLSE